MASASSWTLCRTTPAKSTRGSSSHVRRARRAHRDWYVWADGKEEGELPNNWVSSFGGPGWTLDEATGQYYFHNHLQEQPDLNWWNEDVRAAFDDIFRFWSDRGVAGFRIDVANVIIKDAELRDNPPATEEDDFETQMFGQRSVYNANRPEVHDVIRRWRRLADGYEEPRLLIGETPVPVDKLAEFYGNGSDELGLAFNFNFISAPLRAPEMRAIVEETEAALPPGAWPAWTGSNHDMFRFPTRWAEDDPVRVRLALLMLLSLRGTPVLYEGDEIGMANVRAGPRGPARPTRCALLPVLRGARRRPHAHAVERSPGGRFHRRRTALAAAGRSGRRQRGGPAGRPRLASHPLPRHHRLPAQPSRVQRRGHRVVADTRAGVGVDAGRPPRGGPQHGCRRSWSWQSLPAPFRSAPTERATSRSFPATFVWRHSRG